MAVLTEAVRNVLVIVLVAGFLEMLLPEGNMKPWVRLSIGLFVLIAVLNPVLGALFSGHNFQVSAWDYQPDMPVPAVNIAEQGEQIQEKILGNSEKVVKEKLEGQISAVAVLVPGVEAVVTKASVTKDGRPEKLHLLVKSEGDGRDEKGARVKVFSGGSRKQNEQDEEKIKNKIGNLIYNLYGFEDTAIEIEFEGG